jgi:osmotically-inducible protein OsmY
MHKPKHLLEFDVRDTLDWDAAIDDRRIEVKADDGHVILTGSVPSYYERVRATEDAWSVGGVRTLDNELLVGLEGAVINDTQLEQACRAALDHDRVVPKGAVTPTVRDGHVQLRGHVRNPFQRDAAEFVIGRLDGVLAIENLIAISSEPIPSDVADRVSKAFRRSAIIDTIPSRRWIRIGITLGFEVSKHLLRHDGTPCTRLNLACQAAGRIGERALNTLP